MFFNTTKVYRLKNLIMIDNTSSLKYSDRYIRRCIFFSVIINRDEIKVPIKIGFSYFISTYLRC